MTTATMAPMGPSAQVERALLEKTESPAQRLLHTTRAVRISFSQMSQRRELPKEAKRRAAEQFGADPDSLSMGKRLFDTKHPALADVKAIRKQLEFLIEHDTLPYIERGIRLIPEGRVLEFRKQFEELRKAFLAAVEVLSGRMDEVKAKAKADLAHLYNEADYEDPRDCYDVQLEFPNIEPPAYLRQLSPELYEEARKLVTARFEDTAAKIEQVFVSEFQKTVDQLVASLSGVKDGTQKCFKDSTANQLFEIMDLWKRNLAPWGIAAGSEAQQLLEKTQELVKGYNPENLGKEIRADDEFRDDLIHQLGQVRDSLEGLLENVPARRIRHLTAIE